MFFIKIKVKGYLKNITDNTEVPINTTSIKTTNTISYIEDNTKYKIMIDGKKIIFTRENEEFSHGIIFEENITHPSEYYLKKSNYSLEFNILTTNINITENKIDITYQVIESENIYHYVLDLLENSF